MNQTDKIVTREEAARRCAEARAAGRRVGFSSGAFDLLHAGHADFLEKARARCDMLAIGVNTDASVRRYKGPERPVVPEALRLRLLAALESVDLVFAFEERRNAANIEALKPDFYFKAGDYSSSELTSTEVVEKYGGRAELIPLEINVSTTQLLERALGGKTAAPQQGNAAEEAVSIDTRPAKAAPAAFVDRDGTINKAVEYLHEPEKFELLPGAGEGLRALQDMGYRIVIVTNQAGIGLGYFTKEDFYSVNRAMFRALKPFGVKIDRIYYCPHGVAEDPGCRKPGTLLHERAARELNIDIPASVTIGDNSCDIEAGRRLGCHMVSVATGQGCRDGEFDVRPDYHASDLVDAARWLLEQERNTGKGVD